MNENNSNYLMGILGKKKMSKTNNGNNENMIMNNNNKRNEKPTSENNVLLNQLLKIQENIKAENGEVRMNLETEMNVNKNINNKEEKKKFKNILLSVISKLESDVNKVSNKINSYNEEKKSIVEMNQRDIKRLKNLVKKLYGIILSIYQSLEVNKETRIELLNKLKRNIESNRNLLQNINEINEIRGYINERELINNMLQKNMSEEEMKTAEIVESSPEEDEVQKITIFNIINENKNKNMNKNKNKNKNNTIMNTVTNVITEPVMSVITPELVEPEKREEPKIMKEKKLNVSKKVSAKLNEMKPITNQEARTSLNQFLIQKIGTSNVKKNNKNMKNIQNIQNTSTTTTEVPVPVSTPAPIQIPTNDPVVPSAPVLPEQNRTISQTQPPVLTNQRRNNITFV